MNNKRLTVVVLVLVIPFILLDTSLLSAPAAVAVANTTNTTTIANSTVTPIKHLIVIFQENVAFDHYFGTYPKVANRSGERNFSSSPNTLSINNLTTSLLTNNTNLANPFLLNRSQAATVASCDPSHGYTALQKSFDGGLMDKFVQKGLERHSKKNCDPKVVMGYFDGNTVTALWNYAQHYAMSDNFYSTNIAPSLPGHLNLVSGQTHGASGADIRGMVAKGTVIGDINSTYDECSAAQHKTISMTGKNIGDLMNAKGISWGWFQGGFKPSSFTPNHKPICRTAHMNNFTGDNVTDYVVHHEPFQYYKSTANPNHLAPNSTAMIGKTDRANHQYDISDFWKVRNMPAVSFLKAPQYQTGHPRYSDPINEQAFLVNTINGIQRLPQWNSTAVIIAYDDSGGWYDHVMPPIISQSGDPKYDRLIGKTGLCGHAPTGAYQDRCGYGARLPMLVLSPYAKVNYVDHSVTDQSSILRFIEDNWSLGRIGNRSFDVKAGSIMNMFDFTNHHPAKKLFLNPSTGLER